MPTVNISLSTYYNKGRLIRIALSCCLFLLLGSAVKAQLTADFTASTTNTCGPAIISFTSTVSGGSGANVYSWDLGNGVVSDEANPSTTYFNAGIFTIRLTVTNPATGQTTTVTKTNYITILAPPVVDFAADDTLGCFKHRVNFTNSSVAGSGTIQSFLWNFGNGSQNSTDFNPSTVYTLVSDYPVTLTVTNSNGCTSTLTKSNYIEVTQGVVANFFAPAATGCSPPINIPLQNTSTGPGALTYNWNFGNGSPVSNEQNPTAQYNTGGNYRITLLVTSDQGCFDSISRPVIIPNVGVVSSFDAPDTVCLRAPVQFENTSRPDPDLSVWFWGDGSRNDTSLSPIHTFNTAGSFTVKMRNQFGSCVDSFVKQIIVLPAATASFSSNDTVACRAPHTANFTANAPGAVQWNWDFGDGGTGIGPNPSYTYRNVGNYTVRLTVRNAQGCATSSFVNNYVRIARPRFTVRNLPDSGCLPFTKTPNILVETADGIQSMQWDFGDGTVINSLTPPSHTYTVPGTYRFRLVITTNTGCTDSIIIPNAVKVGALPTTTADFSATPLIACAGEDISFTDLSTNPSQITGWLWDFGDGGRSDDQNPTHRYSDTGRFEVTLTIFNNGCGATVNKEDYIYTYGAVARFNYAVECTDKRTVRFRDSSINATTVRWDFGDGSPAVDNVLNPVHTFASLGRYPVVLTVTQGTCTYADTQYIRLVDERAAFTINPNPLCKGLAVNFSATGSVDSNLRRYEWDFGNGRWVQGNRSVLTSFPLTGLYTTRLRITDINGCRDSASQQLPVGGPRAGLGATNPTGCRGITVNFIDSSRSDGVNPIVQRIWDFGDGTVQTINAPPYQHTYNTPGTYNVKLKIVDAGGCTDSIIFRNFVTASEPRANFTVDSTESCPGSVVRFINLTNQNGGNINNFQWSFGDGTTSVINNPTKIYSTTGIFSVKLKIRDRYGCEDSLTRDSLIRIDVPQANFTLSDSLANCPPLRVDMRFTGHYQQSVRWDFGDGGVTDNLNPSYLYNLPGNYRVRLTVTSPGGCTDTMSKLIVINGPIAQYEFNPTTGCDSLTVNFRAFNTNNVDSIIWDFGDGRVITKDSSITYTYDHPGDFVASILLKDISGCIVPIRGRDTIKVVGFNMGFTADTQVFCDSGVVQFTDTTRVLASVPKTSWQWDFGDGNTSTLQNPRHTYRTTGLFNVRLIVGTANGCTDTVTQTSFIRVVRSPQTDINASVNGVCVGGVITFRGVETVPDTSVLRWSWDFANGQTSLVQNPPAQQYLTPGNYNIQLVTTNSTGCTDTTILPVTIHPIPTVVASQDSTICLGQSIQLNATGTDNYSWLPPNPGLSCTDCPSPLATPTVTTTYHVRGSSIFGCENRDSVTITVIQPSTVVAPPNDSICIGESVVLRASGSQVYSWSPATGLNNINIPNPVARPAATTTYTVTGSDFRGCFTTTDTVRVDVFPIPSVSLGPDITITSGTTNQVLTSTYSNDVVSLLWEPATGLSCTTCPTPVAAPRVSTTYTLRVTNNGGCVSSDAITITVVCLNSNLFMPNTFSPNGDGMNDIYFPRGRGIERIRSLKIFNRWGQMVYIRENFNANDPSAGWDGRYRGIMSAPDVYVYTIDLFCENQSLITLKGDIMLVR